MTQSDSATTGQRVRGGKSLRAKLILLVISSIAITVSLVAGVSAWRDGKRDSALQTERLRVAAAIMGSLSSEAAAHGDRARAFQVLRSISLMPGVRYARIERADGSLLVETGSGSRLSNDVVLNVDANGPGLLAQLHSHTSEVAEPIFFERRRIGRIVLFGRTEGVLSQFLASLLTSLIAALVAAGAGLLVAARLQRAITDPIRALTRSMQAVRRDHDYDRIVDVRADGEIAELVDGFNQMLKEVRARDRRIAGHVAGLEGEVAARTSDFRNAREAAESANQAKSDFLATMSHEIRTPMNGIMVMAEMLAASEMPQRQRRFAEVIANSGSSLLAIINDILDFSKIEAGKMELESEPVDLTEIVEDVCSLFWERAASKGLDLAAFVDPAMPRRIATDPVRLRQVVGNLVNNAIKFTEKGGVLIEASLADPEMFQISVRDTGVGIPADKISTVFGAFSQADQSTTRRFGGTGLGLTICKRIVDAMGGWFLVNSRVGEGSSFAFVAPLTSLEAAPPWPQASTPQAKVVLAHPGLGTRSALKRYLQSAGYQVVGQRPQHDEQVCLILTDPAGVEGLSGLKAPIVCLAADGDATADHLRRRRTIEAIVAQPFRRTDVQALLQRLGTGAPLSDAILDVVPPPKVDRALPIFAQAKVLVADDSAVNREVAVEALARLGVMPTLVEDGRAAVLAATSETFDLILMDGSMPELDGYEAALAIRAFDLANARRRTPIVGLTAHVVGPSADAWREADMDGVLHKPFTLAGLAQEVGRFLKPIEGVALEQAAPMAAPLRASAVANSDLIDPDVAAQLAEMARAGRSDFVQRVNALYRDTAPGCVVQLRDAAAAASSEDAAKAAHALKSMSYNIGAWRVSELAGEIEAAAREGAAPAACEVEELGALLTHTLEVLQPAKVAEPILQREVA